MSDEAPSPSHQRGNILFEQGRFADAEQYFREALTQEPNDVEALFRLALCELNQYRAQDAYATLQRALALAPDVAFLHAIKAHVEVALRRPADALRSVEAALELDPESDDAFTAQAAAHAHKQEWAKAEQSARAALAINPENAAAANQLAHALRLQNRLSESADQVAYMLSQDPEDADNHTAAGWTALQQGRRDEAERHFLEALRLAPNDEGARDGLKEAFRARSLFYRAYLRYCFFMAQFTGRFQWGIIIGLLVVVKLAPLVLGPFAIIVTGLYLLLVLWVHVARPVGNFRLLLDRFARHALDRPEKWEAVASGGAVVLGLVLLVAAMVLGKAAAYAGLTLIGAAFPLAYTFTNRSPGRFLFAAIAALVLAAGAASILEVLTPVRLGFTSALSGLAVLGVIVTTWISNLSFLRRS